MAKNEPTIADLSAKVASLEAEIYTLKAMIKSFVGLDFLSEEPTQAWELRNLLGNWANWIAPEGSDSIDNAESGQNGA